MPNNLKVFRYDNWSGGEFGALGGENAPKNSFSGRNVLVYGTGLIGPRPGLRNITPSGMPAGTLLGFAPTPTPGRDGIFIIGTTAYRFNLFDPSGDSPVSIGSVPNSVGEIVYPKLKTATNIATTVTEGAVVIDQINNTVTDLNSPAGHTHSIYGQQLVLAENTSSNKIFASSLGNLSDWSTNIEFRVGDDWQVTGLELQRNNLVIFKRTGIYLASGGPLSDTNTALTIRRVTGADGVLHPWHLVADSVDSLWYLGFRSLSPSVFTGSVVNTFSNLKFATREDDGTAALPPVKRAVMNLTGQLTPDTQAFVQGGSAQEMFLRHNGIWTYHKFEVPISAMGRGVEENLVLTDGGNPSSPAQFYATRFNIDRPAFTGDGLFQPGDGSDDPLQTSLTLPDFYNQNGRYVRVRSITVNIKKWHTGVDINTFDIDITTLDRTNGAGDVPHASIHWEEQQEGAAGAGEAGIHDRITRPVHFPFGQGWRITLSNLVGVAIDDIFVEYEESDAEPRTNNGR